MKWWLKDNTKTCNSSFVAIKEMLSYICNKPLKIIQKFHHYRIFYKFPPSSYRKYFPSHACHKNCMQFKWIIIHVLIPLWMTDMHDIFIKSVFSTNIIMHAKQMLNLKSEDVLLKKCFPWFPLLLGSSKNTQHPKQLFSMAAANSKASVSK